MTPTPCCTQTQALGAVCLHHRVVHKHRHLGQFVSTTVMCINTGTWGSLYAPPCCTQTQALGAVCKHHRDVHKHRQLGQFVCTAGIDCTTVLCTNTGTWDSLYAPPCCTQTQEVGTVYISSCIDRTTVLHINTCNWNSLYALLCCT